MENTQIRKLTIQLENYVAESKLVNSKRIRLQERAENLKLIITSLENDIQQSKEKGLSIPCSELRSKQILKSTSFASTNRFSAK